MASSKYEPLAQQGTEYPPEHEEIWRMKELSPVRAWKIVYTLSILLGIAILSRALGLAKLRTTQDLLETQSYGTPYLVDSMTPNEHD